MNELLLDLSEKIFISAVTSKVKFLETELSSVSSVRGGIMTIITVEETKVVPWCHRLL